MANEISVQSNLTIKNGNLQYGPSKPQSFRATMTGSKGPSPGQVAVTTGGVNIDLSALTNPSICRIINYDTTNYIEYGRWDGSTFHPCGEIWAGESYPIRLSRNIGTLRLRANTATCNCSVEAFDR